MDKKELIKQLKYDVFTRLGVSKRHGVGVFAIKDIPKGVNPFRGGGEEPEWIGISKDELSLVPVPVRVLVRDMCVFEDGCYQIPSFGLESITKGWYLNHSETPNMKCSDGYAFTAKRRIQVGEELTVDYGTYCEETGVGG